MTSDDADEAARMFRESLMLARHADYMLGQANALDGLGDALLRLDRLDDAEQAYREAIELNSSFEDSYARDLGTANAGGHANRGTGRLRRACLVGLHHRVRPRLSVSERMPGR